MTVESVTAATREAWDATRTEEEVAHPMATQRKTLGGLQTSWDGYGAHPIPSGVLDVIFEEIVSEGCFVDMVPGADGSVQAEWHLRGDVDVEYCISPGGKRELYVRYTRYPPLGGE